MKDLGRVSRRADYRRVARTGRKWVTPGFILQVASPGNGDVHTENGQDGGEGGSVKGEDGAMAVRFGITVSRKASPKAVMRNRIKRRLRALAADTLPLYALPGHDYVLIGRSEGATRNYERMLADMKWALKRLGCRKDRQT